jgi:hypothetical protein
MNLDMRRLFPFAFLFVLTWTVAFGQKVLSKESQLSQSPPLKIKYRLDKKFVSPGNNVISYEDIYLRKEYLCGLRCDTMFTFIRFYSDGRVFVSFPYRTMPTTEQIMDLSYGKYGRYVTRETNKVIVELYMTKQYGVMFMYGTILSDTLQFYATSNRYKPLFKQRETDGGRFLRFKIN